MAMLEFDGRSYDEAGLRAALESAASGVPPTFSRELIDDPMEWAGLLVGEALQSSLAEAARRQVAKLLVSESPDEVRLGVALQGRCQPASAEDTVAAMERLRQQGDWEAVFSLATALGRMEGQGRCTYTPKLRDFAGDPWTRRALMRLYLRHDRPWVVQHLRDLIPPDPASAMGLIAGAISGFSPTERCAVRSDLAPAFNSLPAEVAAAVEAALALE